MTKDEIIHKIKLLREEGNELKTEFWKFVLENIEGSCKGYLYNNSMGIFLKECRDRPEDFQKMLQVVKTAHPYFQRLGREGVPSTGTREDLQLCKDHAVLVSNAVLEFMGK